MIKIQERKPEIPVEIGPLKFSFSVTDESVLNFRKNALPVLQELESMVLDENDEEKALEQAKEMLQKGFDVTLGDGSFEKIYELTPSVRYLADYFVQLWIGLDKEINNMGAFDQAIDNRAKKYTKKKRKK